MCVDYMLMRGLERDIIGSLGRMSDRLLVVYYNPFFELVNNITRKNGGFKQKLGSKVCDLAQNT